ncbi:MAG: GHKL domain-containing protein [Ruminococcaceae bacterium]|nr:GHKL domain-containing protein [Oscillospiraceae bacterium]
MLKVFIDILMYIFEFLLLYNYADSLFFSEKKIHVKVVSIIAINIILCTLYQIGISYINAVVIVLLYTLVFVYIYNTSLKNAVFHAIIFVSIMTVSELAVISLCTILFNDFNAMHSNIAAYIFVVVSSKLIYSSAMMAIKKFFAAKKTKETKDNFFWILFLLPLTSLTTVLLFSYISYDYKVSEISSIFISIVSILLLFADIVVFIIYERAQKNLDELYDLKAINFQQELDKKYFEVIEQSNDEIKHFSHDIKNHLLQIRYIDDIEETHKYLDRLITDVEKISYVGISENKMLNLIVSKYISICEKKGIKFTPSVKLANLSYINDVDLSTLLNNLLDNSVDAAEKSANSEIELYVFSKNSRYDGVIIRNTCVNPPESVGGRLITSKKEKAYHGLGLNIVKKIVKKYDALYDWKYDDNKHIFETDIAIPKQHREGKKKNGV